MARGKGRRKGVGKDSSKENRKSARYEETQLNNENFTKYYKSLGTVLENEWDLFIKSLQTPLPVNYRFTGSRSTAFELKELMIKEYFPDLKKVTIDGISVPIPAPIPWYPNELGWQYKSSRTLVRRSPELSKFHKFLVSETEVGNISRQEAVSMIPPLLLDVKPYHFVMDMCAAPGSKTAQLIEAMHSEKGDDIPDGLLIANDADYDRSYMLVRQTRRLQSPCLMVTNHEAQHFPHILYSGTDPGEKKKGLIFDRILCDAPCSGDGTLRKNKGIWKSWSGNNGNSLHKVQLQILEKGIELLKIGGRIVYSTCSFNPVENEAVVAEILKICGKSVELLDVSKELPELRRTEGLSHWTVMSKDGTIYKNYEDVPKEFRNIILPSAFPPPNSTALGLNKCLRILPHYHDTGGFFVAVFKKVGSFGFLDRFDITDDVSVLNTNVKELPHSEKHHLSDEESRDLKRPKIAGGTADESNLDVVSNDDGNAVREKKGGKRKWRGKESPFIFLAPQSDEVQSVVKFYGIIPNALPIDQFLVRSDSEKKKTIYFCSKSVKNTLQAKNVAKLNIVNSGIKMFTRNEGDGTIGCDFRLCNDGVSIIANVTTKRRIVAKLSDVLILLREPYPKVDKFSSLIIDGLKELGPGSCLFSFNPSTEKSISIKLPMLLPIWRAKASCSLLLDKAECRSLLLRLTGEEYLPKKLEIDKNDNQEVLENSAQQESSAGSKKKGSAGKKETASSASKKNLTGSAGKKGENGQVDIKANADLDQEIKKCNEELAAEKEERNYFQLERDRINLFWEITKKELEETKAEVLNKDRELEEQEEKHQVEIKVYKQKVKHLLYEYQNNVAHLQTDAERSLQIDQEEHLVREQQLKKDKRFLKLELKEFELAHEDIIKNLKQKNDQEITVMRSEFERRAKELHSKYERKMKMVRDELELKRKNEIHEIEERKNGQINALMKNHDKAFTEIKNYYNDITLNNLALINSLKEQVEEMKKKEERNEKLMADITSENKRLSEPLQAALAECDTLKKQLKHYQKDKMSLQNSKARLKVLEEKHKQLLWEHEVLEQRFTQVQKERDELYENFVDRIMGVQQKSNFKNLILEKKVTSLKESLEKKELQVNEILKATNLDPAALTNLTKRLEEVLEAKNQQIKELQYELCKVTKAHNDMVRVYEAKLTEYSIPVEELGFKPLMVGVNISNVSKTTTGPAGLVSAQ